MPAVGLSKIKNRELVVLSHSLFPDHNTGTMSERSQPRNENLLLFECLFTCQLSHIFKLAAKAVAKF
jgi:hypothetical protein